MPEWAWDNLQNHVKHHLLDQDKYWGVTHGFLDRLLGTAPRVSAEDWEKLRLFYMRRSNRMREKVEEMGRESYDEHAERFQDSLEALTDRLYSFLERAL